MNDRRLLDTNVVIRYLVQDDPKSAQIATSLMEACDRGELIFVLLPQVLAECVFVLESFYEIDRQRIAVTLRHLVRFSGIELAQRDFYLKALDVYGSGGLHFVDCTLAVTALLDNLPIATFDRRLGKQPGVRVSLDL